MAKSKVKKGFLFYFGIMLLLIFGVLCIFMSILIFNPGQDVFGIGLKFLSINRIATFNNLTGSETSIHSSNFNTVEFNSNYVNFTFDYDPDAIYTRILFRPNTIALSTSEKDKYELKISCENEKLSISVKEPELWLGINVSPTICFVFPNADSSKQCTFNINTVSGSIGIGDSSEKQFIINDLNITTESGFVSIGQNVSVESQTINIQAETSRMNISSSITGDMSIENTKGRINIGTLAGNLRLINKGNLEASCQNVAGDVFVRSTHGYLNIKNLGITKINNENVYGYVNDLKTGESLTGYMGGNLTTIDYVENTNIIVDNMVGNAAIKGRTGSVTINRMRGQALIETTSGGVEIKEANDKLDIKTEKGGVYVTQVGENAQTTIKTDSGKIVANFAKAGRAELTTKYSNIDINIATGEMFKLRYITKNGISASWVTNELEKEGTMLIFGAEDNTTNILDASAENGKVVVRDGFVA